MGINFVIKIIYHFVRGALDPQNLEHSLRAGSALSSSGALQSTIESVEIEAPGFCRRRALHFDSSIDRFADFPEGTLGRVYHDHMKILGLDPKALRTNAVVNDASYIESLVRSTHDIWHVVTGIGTHIEGEAGLQAFMVRQMNWPFAMLAIAAISLITLFKNPGNIRRLGDEMSNGFELAYRYRPLITVDWNQYWDLPIEVVRARLLRS